MRIVIWAAAIVAVIGMLALTFAPYTYAGYWYADYLAEGAPPLTPLPVALAKGRMFDSFFAVQNIGANVYAIGEPRTDQQNYAYLIVGNDRALLFDTGTHGEDITKPARALTHLPIIAMVSHLHWDHIDGIGGFHDIGMIDLPETRADVNDGVFTPTASQHIGWTRGLAAPSFKVTRWIKPGGTIDLGGRTITVLSTPGHTPTSVSLYDPAAHRLFTGDFIYPTTLYAQLPGASRSAYEATARRLLGTIPPDTILWTAHCCRAGEGIAAPWLTTHDLQDILRVLVAIRTGNAKTIPDGSLYPVHYKVNREMTLVTGYRWNNR